MDIKDVLFWTFLLLGVGLLIWNVFGRSPTEFIALSTLVFAAIFKTWKISDRQIVLEMKFNQLDKEVKALAK